MPVIVRNYHKDLELVALAAGSNVALMEQQVREFHPKVVAMWSAAAAKELQEKIADLPTRVLSGMDGLLEIAVLEEVDVAFYGEYKELTAEDRQTVRDMVRLMRARRAANQEK